MSDPLTILRSLLEKEAVSIESLEMITGVPKEDLESLLNPNLNRNSAIPTLSERQTAALSVISGQLSVGLSIPDNERLIGILEVLIEQFKFNYRNLSTLTGVSQSDIKLVHEGGGQVSQDIKFSLSVRASYILGAVANSCA